MKFLKKLKDLKPAVSIKLMIHKSIAGYEKARSIKHIHASSVTSTRLSFCPRAWALMDITGKKPKDEFVGTSLRVTYDHGIDMQKRLNEDYLRDVMVGDWKCRSCGDVKEFCKRPQGHCGKSGIHCHWGYNEVRVISPTCGMGGGIDALVDVDEPKLMLTEIKTMVKEDFIALQAPLAEHSLRTNLYLRLAEEAGEYYSDRINTKEARILYMVKGFGKACEEVKLWKDQGELMDANFSPYKEYVVKRNDKLTDHLYEIAKPLHHYRDTGKGIPCGICPNSMHKRAKKCPVIKECFSGKYKGTVTWMENGKRVHSGKKLVEG